MLISFWIEVFTAMIMKITVFWVVTPRSFYGAEVYQKYFASIFRVEKWDWRLLRLISYLAYCSTSMMEVTYFSDTSASLQTAWRYNPEESTVLNVAG
jgi:hypothetical protein